MQEENAIILDGMNLFPHITLFSPEFPAHNLEKILDAVKEIASSIAPVTLTLEDIAATSTNGILMNYVSDETILRMREQAITTLNPLREGIVREKYKTMDGLSDAQKEEINAYGYPVRSNYPFPHVTLANFATSEQAQTATQTASTAEVPKTCTPSFIAVGEMGEYGTVTNIIEKFAIV